MQKAQNALAKHFALFIYMRSLSKMSFMPWVSINHTFRYDSNVILQLPVDEIDMGPE